MTDTRKYRRCRYCGAVLGPTDSFCTQCGIDTERSYEGRMPEYGQDDYGEPGYHQDHMQMRYGTGSERSRGSYDQNQSTGQRRYSDDPERMEYGRIREDNVRDEDRQSRYRQERLGSDWSEDWGRPVDEKKMTAMQCVLIVLLVILLAAILALGAFWFFGRSTDRTSAQRGETLSGATSSQSVDDSDIITILDPQDGDTSDADGTAAAAGDTNSDAAQAGNSDTSGNQSSDLVSADNTFEDETQNAASGQDSTASDGSGDSDSTQLAEGSQSSDAALVQNGNGEASQDGDAFTVEDSQANDNGQSSSAADDSQEEADVQDGTSIENAVIADDSVSEQDQSTAASWSQPESSQRLLTADDLAGLDYDELQMVINEIYARHGRIFKTPEIGSYFESQSWYEGTLDADHFDESVFSAIENQNIQTVLEAMGDN